MANLKKEVTFIKYDYILINPPYNTASSILDQIKVWSFCSVILAPINAYRNYGNWKCVNSFEQADSSVFNDAQVTKGLGITVFLENGVTFDNWNELEKESFNIKFRKVYDKIEDNENIKFTNAHGHYFHSKGDVIKDVQENIDQSKSFFIFIRAVKNGVHKTKNCYDHKYNYGLIGAEGLPIFDSGKGKQFALNGCFAIFPTVKAKENFRTFWYKGELMNMLLHGLNSDGGHSKRAIPRIDWDAISESEMWKQGFYDKAVLDEMGLEWNTTKTEVLKKI